MRDQLACEMLLKVTGKVESLGESRKFRDKIFDFFGNISYKYVVDIQVILLLVTEFMKVPTIMSTSLSNRRRFPIC